jgi:hypothetical protein
VEGYAHAQADARHLEEVAPHIAGEDGVPVADNGSREAVEAYNAVDVGVAQGDKVGVFGESINHRQDDRFPADLVEPLDEVHGHVHPDLGRHWQGCSNPAGSRAWVLFL